MDLVEKKVGCEFCMDRGARQSACECAQGSDLESGHTATDSNRSESRLADHCRAQMTRTAHDELQPQI